jgi:predicted MFS family arabinose efflux permease
MSNNSGDAAPPVWTRYTSMQRAAFLAILFLVSTSNYADRQVVALLIEPIKAEFGVSDAMIGMLTGFAFAFVYAVFGIPVAWLADRSDRKWIISLSLFAWSIATRACGMAQSFAQLVVARAGVGVGEAGAIPPAQSLIADYFPPAQRARALAIFMASAMTGYMIAFALGGYIAAAHGWRQAFLLLGLPGILLGLIGAFGLREPRRIPTYAVRPGEGESLPDMLRALSKKPSYILLVVTMILYYMVAYGATVTWFPSYLIRVLHVDLRTVGTLYGVVQAGSSVLGTLVGGFITDALVRRDERWLTRLPGILLVLCFPLYELALLVPNFTLFTSIVFVAAFMQYAAMPPIYAALHKVCGSQRRAMAIAVAFFFANLLGLGCGPLLTGKLSDVLSASYGPMGLGYALMLVVAIFIPCGMILYRTSRFVEADVEN